MSFWQDFPKPFTVLAPMDGVTDTVFRQIVASCVRPDVFFTEFTSVDGFLSAGRTSVIDKLKYDKSEHPIVAQVWGSKPELFSKIAPIIVKMGFDGMDINMGCPDRTVVKSGGGAALIDNPKLVSEIVEASKSGLGGKIPLSIKTRLGNKIDTSDEWFPFLLSLGLNAISVHVRTAKAMSGGPAYWEKIGLIVKLRNQISPKTQIIGNGDIKSLLEVKNMYQKYKPDGVMIGRGIFQNMWVFDKNQHQGTKAEKFNLLIKHIKLYEKIWGDQKHFAPLKKFFKVYVNGFNKASYIREKLMISKNFKSALKIIKENNS